MGFNKIISREESLEQSARDYRDHNLTDLESINKIMYEAIQAIEEHKVPYGLMGGLASKELGRPRVTHDIDVFVRPDDAEKVLHILEKHGFETQQRDPHWLFKAWKNKVLVDVIFKSFGGIYFDKEVCAHVRRIPYDGFFVNTISPEDLVVIKAAAYQEQNPHYWYDALAVLAQGNLDWDYLLKRAKHAPRRILSVLIYAQSIDLAVPTDIIQRLYRMVFESQAYVPGHIIHPYQVTKEVECVKGKDHVIYTKGKIMEELTTDERIAEHDINIVVTDNTVLARGEVFTEEQRVAVEEVIKRVAPSLSVMNQIYVRKLMGPEGSEVIR